MDFRTAPILVQMQTMPAFPVRKTFTVDFEVLPAPWVSKQNKVVLQNLLICVILFHTVYYEVLGMCCMIFRAYELDVLAPFDFKTNPLWLNTNLKVIVLLISTQVTYFVCGLLFVLVVEERLWDYAISVTILHAVITLAVMLEFPLTSHWWAALEDCKRSKASMGRGMEPSAAAGSQDEGKGGERTQRRIQASLHEAWVDIVREYTI
ncbi:transmembrane protein 244 [Canis lupus familiaris]|uniref:transmembrane protein 244 n=1 Tax=Canis lupus familiaris TaxID=9615 RepID=UPI000225692A|nr:transmembrane protein 244 [Canis lupus familiaris]XP_038381428.1 transmembrane protein 244 [Canis lupus familiaris]XP_038509539.1 transmembrane protein 244 [Canis lupus familiaris]|eukprot:XP_022282073.1 transmembrane protein 244 [Canis lupus familiaris]